jgi:hypothetical protein
MQYKIVQLGTEYSKSGIKELESFLNTKADEGYKFHSVFQVQKPGCMGIGSPTVIYLAIFIKE